MAQEAMQDAQENFNLRNDLSGKAACIASLDTLWRQQQQEALDEAGGLKGTRIKGVADATKFKQKVADQTRQKPETAQSAMDLLTTQRAQNDSLAFEQALAGISDESLLLKIKAMEKLLEKESSMKHIYWAFTALMFLLEFLVIIFKGTMKKSAYDLEIEAIERIQKERNKRVYGDDSPYLMPHEYHPQAKSTSQKLSRHVNTLL